MISEQSLFQMNASSFEGSGSRIVAVLSILLPILQINTLALR